MYKLFLFIILFSVTSFSSKSDIKNITKMYERKGVHLKLYERELTFDAKNNKNLTDEDMAYLSSLKNVLSINLTNTNITDKGISFLINIKELIELNLTSVNITDSALYYISQLPRLKYLTLESTPITNKSLIYIFKLRRLKTLNLYNTKIELKDWPVVNPDSIKLEYLCTPVTEIKRNDDIVRHILLWSTGRAPEDGNYIIGNVKKSLKVLMYKGDVLE